MKKLMFEVFDFVLGFCAAMAFGALAVATAKLNWQPLYFLWASLTALVGIAIFHIGRKVFNRRACNTDPKAYVSRAVQKMGAARSWRVYLQASAYLKEAEKFLDLNKRDRCKSLDINRDDWIDAHDGPQNREIERIEGLFRRDITNAVRRLERHIEKATLLEIDWLDLTPAESTLVYEYTRKSEEGSV